MRKVDIDRPNDQRRTDAAMTAVRSELGALRALLQIAEVAQWTLPPVRAAREPGEPRNPGRRADPTAETAVDASRLELRAAVVRSQKALAEILSTVSRVRGDLTHALVPWMGEDHNGD